MNPDLNLTDIENPENKENNKTFYNTNKPFDAHKDMSFNPENPVKTRRNPIKKKLLNLQKKNPLKNQRPENRRNLKKSQSLTETTVTNKNQINLQNKSTVIVSQKTFTSQLKKNFDIQKYYQEKENKKLITNFGSSVFRTTKLFDQSFKIGTDFLHKNGVNQIAKEIHLRMISWMIEVLSVYQSNEETFFLSVKLMDTFISKSKERIKTEDIHLIGVTSMFIASKFEDLLPIQLSSFVDKISHHQFSRLQITSLEKKIISTIGFESLVTVSAYEFIRTYFYDFTSNNFKEINENGADTLVNELQKISIYLAKMIYHFEEFYALEDDLKSIACLMTAFAVIKQKSTVMNSQQEKLIFEWIQYVIRTSNYDVQVCVDSYNKVTQCFEKFHMMRTYAENLQRFFPLTIK